MQRQYNKTRNAFIITIAKEIGQLIVVFNHVYR